MRRLHGDGPHGVEKGEKRVIASLGYPRSRRAVFPLSPGKSTTLATSFLPLRESCSWHVLFFNNLVTASLLCRHFFFSRGYGPAAPAAYFWLATAIMRSAPFPNPCSKDAKPCMLSSSHTSRSLVPRA